MQKHPNCRTFSQPAVYMLFSLFASSSQIGEPCYIVIMLCCCDRAILFQEEAHQLELSQQQNRATDAAAQVEALHADLGDMQQQVSELHSLNEALARDLSCKGKAQEDADASLHDLRSRCSAVYVPQPPLLQRSFLIHPLLHAAMSAFGLLQGKVTKQMNSVMQLASSWCRLSNSWQLQVAL
jgi:TolA-binding protein